MEQDTLYYFLNALGNLFRMRRIYPQGSKQVLQCARQASQRLVDWGKSVRVTFLGHETIVEDRSMETSPLSFRALFESLQQLGLESVQIEANAKQDDLIAWIEKVVSKDRTPYRSPKIVTGSLRMERRAEPYSALTRAVAGYLGFLAEAQETLLDLQSKKSEGLVRAREIVSAITARLAVGRELFEPIRELKDFDDYTFTHAINVCVLSSALARALRVSEEMVSLIATAALCHDLGKKEVPKEILNFKGSLEPQDRLVVEKHPFYGARLLLDIPGVELANPLLPVVAYQHHMGANQSGYPKIQERFQQYTLHFSSLIVGVVDVYDALRTVRPYRPALSVAKASTILIRDAISGRLHKEYVSAFLLLLNVLVAGQRVVLSDGSRGMIIETRTGYPLCPVISDEDGVTRDLYDPSAPTIWEVEEDGISNLQ
jgi:HD-GYP domain-containing protein (c-di-GMP phosphodiesterase class II)